jgi:hypothetical protein
MEDFRDSEFKILGAVSSPAHGTDYFGEVAGGQIEFKGNMIIATLLYTSVHESKVDPLHYKLSIGTQVVPLCADYCLSSNGPGQVRDLEKVYCLGNFVGKDFTASLVARRLESAARFERIGIVARPHVDSKVAGFVVNVNSIDEEYGASSAILV